MPKRISPIPPGGGFRAPKRGGRGRMGGFGLGPGGECVCPNCGTKVPHRRSIPCYEHRCPKCGQPMTRAR